MKTLTAQDLYETLSEMHSEGFDLSKILLNYRTNSDSDVEPITFVGEDLFDQETNSILTSIVFMSDDSDY